MDPLDMGEVTGLEGERLVDRVDGERLVDFSEGEPILPDSTRDDTDAGWSERPIDRGDWLRDERPPHWE